MIEREQSQSASVCVVIAAYNAAETIARAIASALHEPEVSEVVVVDDLSTDHTIEVAQKADDGSGRLKILTQKKNEGPSAARNCAITESRAPWIALLDADDFFLPGRIKHLLTLSDKADFIADDAGQTAEGQLDGPYKSLLGATSKEPRALTFAEFVLSNINDPKRERGELGFLKPIMRRTFLEQHKMHYQEGMRLGEDYELYARALALGARFYITPHMGYISVVRTHSLSSHHSEIDLLHLRDCDESLAELPGLTDSDKQALRKHYLNVDCKLQWRLLIIAVKNRNPGRAFATLMRPLPVPFFVLGRLFEQLFIRSGLWPKSQ